MELVQGGSAQDRLMQGPLPIAEALKIGEDVARALEAIAQVGIVHRDVKPQNILLGPGGIAKLSDFGIAKELGGRMLTTKGTGLGSLPYAAPEQIRDASSVDPRTDVYGLGATLYHLISGRTPFPSRGIPIVELVRCILDKPPLPLRGFRPECPPDVEQLIYEMLAKEPGDRPQPPADLTARLCELRVRHHPEALQGGDASLTDTADDE
jgi:serine/threonine protein kinase